MESAGNINTDLLLKDLGGCGLFQVLLIILSTFCLFPLFWTFSFMSFGIYNPGWRCLDNITSTLDNDTVFADQFTKGEPASNQSAILAPAPVYRTDTCQGFDSCRRVEFNPETSTLVTEWALVCSKAWVPSLIISLKMAGDVVGLCVVGYIGDRFGRKLPFHISLFIFVGLQLLMIFSVSWEMFAVLSFLLGVTTSFGTLVNVLKNELVPPAWRIRVTSLPIWALSFVLFSVLAMLLKDWKKLTIAFCVTMAISVIPIFWVPESLRWLIVNNRENETEKVIHKISSLNKAEKPEELLVEVFIKKHKNDGNTKRSPVTVFHLFKKGYRLTACIIGFTFFTMNLVYFALSFGVSTLPGNLYVNMIILSVSELPANVVSPWVGNNLGRKRSAILFSTIEAFSLIGVALVDIFAVTSIKNTVMLVLVTFGKAVINITWYQMVTGSLEMYPTIARCTVSSYSYQTANIGSIFAPYLIPSDPDTLYLCYLVMGGVTLVCGLALCFIPETKGTQYQDTWKEVEVDIYQRECHEANGVV